jgi:hypothetical protein
LIFCVKDVRMERDGNFLFPYWEILFLLNR